ncbi:uncharacterized protein LOC143298360 isoform X2 [Babylonia areolata]|uniref:uncharacterized protein LOC143298360 isoform X2 n=1 Tax=Babylonia areolata TaxID=304850 RepID=UPI003FD57D26
MTDRGAVPPLRGGEEMGVGVEVEVEEEVDGGTRNDTDAAMRYGYDGEESSVDPEPCLPPPRVPGPLPDVNVSHTSEHNDDVHTKGEDVKIDSESKFELRAQRDSTLGSKTSEQTITSSVNLFSEISPAQKESLVKPPKEKEEEEKGEEEVEEKVADSYENEKNDLPFAFASTVHGDRSAVPEVDLNGWQLVSAAETQPDIFALTTKLQSASAVTEEEEEEEKEEPIRSLLPKELSAEIAAAATTTTPTATELSTEIETAAAATTTRTTVVITSPTQLPAESTEVETTSFTSYTGQNEELAYRETVTMADVQTEPLSAPALAKETTTMTMAGKTASCKYRWGKVVPTSAKRVIFFCSALPNEPVFLHWSPAHEAFYSEEMLVPCGDYAGHVIVEGKTYPVEPFGIRSYTFEVDLFLKEDVIEDEVATRKSLAEEQKFQQQQQQGPVDVYRDISSSAFTSPRKMEENGAADSSGIRHNSKYEDLLRQQLQHKDSLDANLESELTLSQKAEQLSGGSGSKRLTPVGDIDKEPFQDGYSSLPPGNSGAFDSSLLARSSERHTPQNLFSGSASDLRQDFETDRLSTKSAELASSHQSFGDSPAGDPVLGKPPSRAGSELSGGVGSGRVTPKQQDSYEPLGGSRPGSAGITSMDRRIDDVLGGYGSRSSSARQSLTREPIGDVLGNEATLTSPARSLASGSARQTPERDVGVLGSSRSTPQRETVPSALRGSQERLFGSQELASLGEAHSLPGSRPLSLLGSRPGSVAGSGQQGGSSRAQSLNSLTSEQELSQFLDANNSHSSAGKRSAAIFDTHPDESSLLPPIMRGDRDRPSSLPAHATQSPIGADKRTYTPPDTTWSPLAAGGFGDPGFQRDLPPRATSKSSLSSRASSRTVTPVSAAGDREDSAKVHDLEETVATLRKLLSSREAEVHELSSQLRDLKDINQSLKNDLDHARSRRVPSGPEDMERQYEQLLQEKEILAGEVVKLRDRLESTRGTGVDSFSTHSSTSMQRRIDELESHVRDLRHSNDSTAQKLLRSEKTVRELKEENSKLRSASLCTPDLDEDRSGRFGDRHHQIEVQQLKEDVRTLRDRNYTLQDEIIGLREGRDPGTRTGDLRSREPLLRDAPGRAPLMTSSSRGDEAGRPRLSMEALLRDGSGIPPADHSRPKHLPTSDLPASPGRRLDRSYGSDSFPGVSARDPHPRALDRSFGSDQGMREGLRETSSYSLSRLENGDRERSGDRALKYKDFVEDRETDLRRTSNRYDQLRSRPDGEVSEKVHASDAGRYGGTLSAEKLRSLDHELERERGKSKVSMSAERLRLLEEAERNRERRVQAAASTAGRRTVSADNHVSSKDFYHSVKNLFGPRGEDSKREKYSTLHGSLPSSMCTDKSSVSDLLAKNDTHQRKSEANHSDDSDSTAVLMSYDVKSDPFSGQREKEKSAYSERSRSQDAYYDRAYFAEREREKQRDREYRDLRGGGGGGGGHRETNGEDSDTATDILLSVEPGKMAAQSTPRRRHHHHRRSSIGDEGSLSSLSDGDEPPQDSLRRRSKSADPKGKKEPSRYGQTLSLRPAASNEILGGGSSGKTVSLSSGFRTVTPQPLATQHNKHALLQQQQASLACSLTQGLRPFAPRSPGDVRAEDIVKFSRQGGKISQGMVKFVGHLPGRSDVYLGVELYKEEGKHDGTFEGVRYFKCKPSKGVFVAFNKVVMAWAPN